MSSANPTTRRRSRPKPAGSREPRPPGSNASVLVVEDSPTQALQLTELLAARGYGVTVAGDGAEALQRLAESRPALVLSDITMPGMDGYELCRRIKADVQQGDLPVLLVTSLSNPGDVVKGLECGADDFIVKPYVAEDLLARVEFNLANSQLHTPERPEMGVEISFAGQRHFISSGRLQILNLLLSTYETAVKRNLQLERTRSELEKLNEHLGDEVGHRTAALRSSEERFRIAAESLSDVIYEWDIGDRVDWYGDIDKLMGYGQDQFPRTFQGWAATIHPRDRDRVTAAVERHLKDEAPYEVEYRVQRKDGSHAVWSARGIAVRDASGTPIRWIGAIRDVTEQRQTEDALRRARERAQLYLDIAGVILVAIDADLCITMINRAGCDLLGFEEPDLIGRNWFELCVPAEDREATRVVFQQLLAGAIAPVEYFENQVVTRDGGSRLVAWHNRVLTGEEGHISGTLSSGEDITERRRAEDELRRHRDQLEQLVEERTAELRASRAPLPRRRRDGLRLRLRDRRRRRRRADGRLDHRRLQPYCRLHGGGHQAARDVGRHRPRGRPGSLGSRHGRRRRGRAGRSRSTGSSPGTDGRCG